MSPRLEAEYSPSTTTPSSEQNISRLARTVLFLMPVLAALGPFASLNPGSSGAPYAYRVLIAVSAVPALVALFRRRAQDLRTTALMVTTVGFVLWGTLALTWTPNFERGGRQLVGALIGLLGCWVAIGLAGRHRAALTALRHGFVVAASVLAAIGVWQYISGNNLWTMFGQPFNFSGNPLIGTFINPNNYAAFLLGCLGPIIAMSIAGQRMHRLFGIPLVLLLMWILTNTDSRTGVLGLAIICFLACVIVGFKLPKSQAPLLVGAIAIAGVAALNFSRLRDLLSGVNAGTEASDDLRVQLSKIAFSYFIDSRGVGIGPAGFEVRLESDPTANVIRILPPHNTFLEIAAEYGAPVIVPFLFLMVSLGIAALRQPAQEAKVAVSTRVELLACFIAIVAGALVASSLIADPGWWLLIGYALLLARQTFAQPDDQEEPQENGVRRSTSPNTLRASARTTTSQPTTKTSAIKTS